MKLMVDPAFPDHIKIRKLAASLKINPYQAVGHVLSMWGKVMQQRESGDLHDWDEIDIALVSGWTGDPKDWTSALIKIGLLERKRGKLLVHEWLEHQGNLIQRRKDWKDRQKRHRHVTRDIRVTARDKRDSHASPSPTLPSPTTTTTTPSHTVPFLAQPLKDGNGHPVDPQSIEDVMKKPNLREGLLLLLSEPLEIKKEIATLLATQYSWGRIAEVRRAAREQKNPGGWALEALKGGWGVHPAFTDQDALDLLGGKIG